MSSLMRTLASDEAFDLAAPPDRVFPLLCPVREHEWIPTWRATVVHSRSGVAELDCLCVTDSPAEGRRTWICTRYEPGREVAYTSFSSAGYVMQLEISLQPEGKGTRVRWRRRFVACDEAGNAWIDALVAQGAPSTKLLARLLGHFLETGTMLRP
jgi:hypothetical protein